MSNWRTVFILVVFFGMVQTALGNTIKREDVNWSVLHEIASQTDVSSTVEFRSKNKAVAITLAVTLGVFGVHRLYLGTSNKVPIIYTLTLGGGFGVLMLSDIVALITTQNINTYSPSEKVFMWAK